MTIIIDSDGLIGSIDPQDIHYLLSSKIHNIFNKKETELIYPATAIAEAVTFLQGRGNKPELAYEILKLIQEDELKIEPVDNYLIQEAVKLMDLKKSKHHTLFDCIVAATAIKYNADAIFSFDKFYKSKGFKLASEL